MIAVTPASTRNPPARTPSQFYGVRARDLFDTLPSPALLSSENTMRATPNQRWREYAGEAWDGRGSWLDLVHEDQLPAVETAWRASVQSAHELDVECRLRRYDGAVRWHRLRGRRLQPHAVSRPEWLIVAYDIDSAREDMRRQSEFLAYVAHEVATPLTVIWGNAHLLKERFRLLTEHDRAAVLDDLEADAERLRRLTTNLLALAHTREERTRDLRTIDLRGIAERVVRQHARHFPMRRIRLAISNRATEALGVETYVEEVLNNYLANAEKYTPDRSSEFEVIANRCGHEVRVRVLDRGVGIDASRADDLFRAFVRGSATAGMAPGSGLGLAVCRWLVELQGGSVWARPRAPGGSEFGFSLPVAAR
ncbi:MAG TPA: PAS domain-containing sensor histidine kinase [Dehalococcoidia bacterium]|nr:PAS domain-containing sensor histidine kinase [Dehalococcoidia bacterium]